MAGRSGEYRLTMDPSEKDALTEIPGAAPGFWEQSGLARRRDRYLRLDGTRLPRTPYQPRHMQPFERLGQFMRVQQPPPVKFKDLEAVVTTRIRFDLLPFELRADFLRITDGTVLVPLTLAMQKKDLSFRLQEGLHQAEVNVFGRLTTLGGRIVETFEDVIRLDIPSSLFESALAQPALYQKAVPLRPGLYKLDLVLKDVHSGHLGTVQERLAVPRFEEGKLAHSSLILADLIERVPAKEVGQGQFVVGSTKVRPSVGDQFRQHDRVGLYLHVYNLAIDPTTQKPYATISYAIRRGDQLVYNKLETTADLARAGQQITLEKVFGVGSLAPGNYELQITVTDWVRQQTIQPTAKFRVLP